MRESRRLRENLPFGAGRTFVGKEEFSRHLRMRRQGIIERETNRGRENGEEKKGREHADEADACGQHRDNFVRARHSPENKKQRQRETGRRIARICGIWVP